MNVLVKVENASNKSASTMLSRDHLSGDVVPRVVGLSYTDANGVVHNLPSPIVNTIQGTSSINVKIPANVVAGTYIGNLLDRNHNDQNLDSTLTVRVYP